MKFHTKPVLQATLQTILSVFLFFYPWGLVFISFRLLPLSLAWLGSIFLIAMGTLSGLWLTINYGQRGLMVASIILLVSWLIEHIGVTTGFPFGAYRYTHVLVPKVIGVVPLAMSFAWLLVVPAAIGVTNRLLEKFRPLGPRPETPQRAVLAVSLAASLATLLDVVMEPAISHIPITNYWVWEQANFAYYGVPISNFVAWWVVSVPFVLLLRWLERQSREQNPHQILHYPWLPQLLYLLLLTQFVLINLSHGFVVAAMVGVPMMCYLIWDFCSPVFGHHPLCSPRETQQER